MATEKITRSFTRFAGYCLKCNTECGLQCKTCDSIDNVKVAEIKTQITLYRTTNRKLEIKKR